MADIVLFILLVIPLAVALIGATTLFIKFVWDEIKRDYKEKDSRIKELEEGIRASERFRMADAGSAISEANHLRVRIKQLERTVNELEERLLFSFWN
jgi:hypothetical protein